MPSSEDTPIAVVVSDTSPILNLALVDRLELLAAQFGRVRVPERVRDELLAGEDGVDRILEFLESDVTAVTSVERTALRREFVTELDAGEAAALALAIESDAELVLIDEREGRAVARRHGLAVTGVVGILLKAANEGALDIENALSELRDAGFWIGEDLYRRAVESVTDESNG